jgi:hypothetical protein
MCALSPNLQQAFFPGPYTIKLLLPGYTNQCIILAAVPPWAKSGTSTLTISNFLKIVKSTTDMFKP